MGAAGLVSGACSSSSGGGGAASCADGGVCPTGRVCNANQLCVPAGSGGAGATGGGGGVGGLGGTSGLGGASGFGGTSGMGGTSGFGGTSGMGGTSGFGGTSGMGGGGGADPCNPVGSTPGSCTAADPNNACQVCVQNKCCGEFAACAGESPNHPCGWGGPSGTGEIVCFQECLFNAGVADPSTQAACAASCTTPGCGTISNVTNTLITCLDNNCFAECLQAAG
jgi:hypothetical protein